MFSPSSPDAVTSILRLRADKKIYVLENANIVAEGAAIIAKPIRAARLQCVCLAGRRCQGVHLGEHGLSCRSDRAHGAGHRLASAHRRRTRGDGCDQSTDQIGDGAGHHRSSRDAGHAERQRPRGDGQSGQLQDWETNVANSACPAVNADLEVEFGFPRRIAMAKRGSSRRTVVTQLLLGAAFLACGNLLPVAAARAARRKGKGGPRPAATPSRGRQEPQARPIHLASRTRAERPRRHHRLGAEAARLCLSQRHSDRCLDLLDGQERLRDSDRRVHHLGESQGARFERVRRCADAAIWSG